MVYLLFSNSAMSFSSELLLRRNGYIHPWERHCSIRAAVARKKVALSWLGEQGGQILFRP